MEEPKPCRNCGAERTGPFCATCGQDERVERLTVAAVVGPVWSAMLSLESRPWQTIFGLTRNPGRVAAEYVEGKRVRYVHPLRYYIMVLAFSALVVTLLGADPLDETQAMFDTTLSFDPDASEEHMSRTRDFLGGVLANAMIATLPALAGVLFLFFRRANRTFAECNVLAIYAAAQAQLLGMVAFLFSPLAPEPVDGVRKLIAVVWFSWSAVVFFGAPRVTGVLRVVAALFLYLVASLFVLLGFGVFLT
jgi:hypothetical protein